MDFIKGPAQGKKTRQTPEEEARGGSSSTTSHQQPSNEGRHTGRPTLSCIGTSPSRGDGEPLGLFACFGYIFVM